MSQSFSTITEAVQFIIVQQGSLLDILTRFSPLDLYLETYTLALLDILPVEPEVVGLAAIVRMSLQSSKDRVHDLRSMEG